jgi:hypothetical protein
MSQKSTSYKYSDSLRVLESKFPYIRYLNHQFHLFGDQLKASRKKSVAAVLKFYVDNDGKVSVAHENLNDLQTHFNERPNGPCTRHLYIIQDLNKDSIETLGNHLWIDPFLFASQSWVAHYGYSPKYSMPHKLPSLSDNDSIVTLRYHELRVLDKDSVAQSTSEPLDLKLGLPRKAEFDSEDWLHKDKQSVNDKNSETSLTFLVRRNASFWVKKESNGWDGT